MTELPIPKILTVTEITRSIKGMLETGFPFVTVTGEVSNLSRPLSGHLYFSLKDATAQLQAVLFKPQQRYIVALPRAGDQVICRGRISVYEPRGNYQLIVDFVEARGAGDLQMALEQRKQQLAAEGLFAEENKKALPLLPARVALVTSPSGAAVHDFLTVAEKRFPSLPIEIFPVRVQGQEAAAEIRAAILLLNQRKNSEVIVICRGGGSLEDLWPFNDESLARAIHDSRIPVVSAVGHEIDFTIADFVADRRAPTPSAAAEMVIPDRQALLDRVGSQQQRLLARISHIIQDRRSRVHTLLRFLGDPRTLLPHFLLRLDHGQTAMIQALTAGLTARRGRLKDINARLLKQTPVHQLATRKQRVAELSHRLRTMIRVLLSRKENRLGQTVSLLEAVGPTAVLNRGYAIVRARPGGEVVRAASQVTRGQALDILLHRGRLECEVTRIKDD
ncbi:MAG: exodeoxyribonuclease VII large subunit [Desulfobacterales bacterium]|nr:exodeoxyribonuclease VII large subunit [Desulfobacterales bacterium]